MGDNDTYGWEQAQYGEPVHAAYTPDGALDMHCPACGAEPRYYCTANGRPRRMACVERLQLAYVTNNPLGRAAAEQRAERLQRHRDTYVPPWMPRRK